MRRAYGFLLLSCAVFGSAVGFSPQQDPLAEQQFKNIKSFKGAKASDVIPAMQFMSASLKVNCDYCHTADRASDEKETKNTTREMISMQHDINAKFFDGRNQITCASCHNGHTHPLSVPPVIGLEVRPHRSADIVPAEILAAYGKAVPAHPISGLRLDGTIQTAGEKSRMEATYSGDKYQLLVHGAKGDQKQGFNGTLAWFSTEHGIQSVPLQYAVQYVNMKTIFAGLDSLPKLTNPTGGTAKLDGRDQSVLTGTISGDKTRLALYFDKQTGLLSRSVFSYPTILGNISQVNDYSDYKKVDGVPLPMTIINHTAEGDTTVRYQHAKVDSKLDATAFDPPK